MKLYYFEISGDKFLSKYNENKYSVSFLFSNGTL